MTIRERIKQALRLAGDPLVSSVHERLTGLELRLDDASLKLDQIYANQRETGAQVLAAWSQINHLSVQANELLTQSRESAGQLREVAANTQDLSKSDTALLEGSIHLIQLFQRSQESHRDACRDQADLRIRVEAVSAKVLAKLEGVRAELSKMLSEVESVGLRLPKLLAEGDAVAGIARQAAESSREAAVRTFDNLSALRNDIEGVLQNDVVRQVCVETSDYDFANPEIGLLSHLYSYLPSRRAIDVGAHVGDVSDTLVKLGYEVYAFEPLPASYQRLIGRVGDHPDFHPFPFAIGSSEGDMPLHLAADNSSTHVYGDVTVFSSLAPHGMPDDLPFAGSIPVPVRTLSGLHSAGTLPADIGLLKIDTEGFDLEVIRGMGEHLYPVVCAEYWDREIPFGQSGLLYTFESLVTEMKSRGYAWHVVIYRIWGLNQTAFYCNHHKSVPHSWGNIVFFRNHELFARAQEWCSAVLPRTYFRIVPVTMPENDAVAR